MNQQQPIIATLRPPIPATFIHWHPVGEERPEPSPDNLKAYQQWGRLRHVTRAGMQLSDARGELVSPGDIALVPNSFFRESSFSPGDYTKVPPPEPKQIWYIEKVDRTFDVGPIAETPPVELEKPRRGRPPKNAK